MIHMLRASTDDYGFSSLDVPSPFLPIGHCTLRYTSASLNTTPTLPLFEQFPLHSYYSATEGFQTQNPTDIIPISGRISESCEQKQSMDFIATTVNFKSWYGHMADGPRSYLKDPTNLCVARVTKHTAHDI